MGLCGITALVGQFQGLTHLVLCREKRQANSNHYSNMNNLEQNILRENLMIQVKRHLGCAEDVHEDFISVNENTLEVGFRSRLDDRCEPNVEYYSILDLIEMNGLWFKPDAKTIEAIVQEHLPSPEVKDLRDNAINSISNFLRNNKPSDLRTCEICIGDITRQVSCYDSNNATVGADETSDLNDDPDLGCYEVYPMRGIVRRTNTGYKISGYKLTKILLDFLNPQS